MLRHLPTLQSLQRVLQGRDRRGDFIRQGVV